MCAQPFQRPTKGEGRLPELPDKLGKVKSRGKACFWECGRKPSASQQPGNEQAAPSPVGSMEQLRVFGHISVFWVEVRLLASWLMAQGEI